MIILELKKLNENDKKIKKCIERNDAFNRPFSLFNALQMKGIIHLQNIVVAASR